ncbi:YidH family protein [Luteibacter sp. Lutesp34]|uniref:YidH family protein n=1 Tax=Luteibacter sp. Lutesp34 TaxID=3243030 RepID=UPI0039B4FFB9
MIPRFTDHAANERTYLAWVRTAIAVMAFGFLLERFNLFLAYALPPRDHAPAQLHVRASEWLGLGLIVVGALMTMLATWRYHRNRTLIASETAYDYTGGPQRLLAALVVLMAIFLVVYVARQLVALG